jgi:predicted RNA-binding Zn-ribbon protein involved in translation (DUF1610 family)
VQDEAFISRTEGKVLLEYCTQGRRTLKLWEAKRDGTLETTFDGDGAILAQQLFGVTNTESRIKDVMGAASASAVRERAYEEVRLNKACPHCGEARLVRSAHSASHGKNVLVMPVYDCDSCHKQSYHLTDEYLAFMVDSNKHLFEDKERADLEKDRQAFLHELKEYIIRIFAAKHVARIR